MVWMALRRWRARWGYRSGPIAISRATSTGVSFKRVIPDRQQPQVVIRFHPTNGRLRATSFDMAAFRRSSVHPLPVHLRRRAMIRPGGAMTAILPGFIVDLKGSWRIASLHRTGRSANASTTGAAGSSMKIIPMQVARERRTSLSPKPRITYSSMTAASRGTGGEPGGSHCVISGMSSCAERNNSDAFAGPASATRERVAGRPGWPWQMKALS